jgi:hypothetical protein
MGVTHEFRRAHGTPVIADATRGLMNKQRKTAIDAKTAVDRARMGANTRYLYGW